MTDPWPGVREWLCAPQEVDDGRITPAIVETLLYDADDLHEIALAADDMLEEGQLWSVNPTKLMRLRKLVEALPERLRNETN